MKAEGLQLMNLMLREKKTSRNGALKVLNHALTGTDVFAFANCIKFVDVLGLRTIFPLFMKTPKKQRRKGVSVEQHEEHVVSIVASLLKNCKGTQKQRILTKFTESDHEKVERLMELHFKYVDQVAITEERLRTSSEEMDEDEIYLERLNGGLYVLQLIGKSNFWFKTSLLDGNFLKVSWSSVLLTRVVLLLNGFSRVRK